MGWQWVYYYIGETSIVNYGLWTLFCDFAYTINVTLKCLTQLPALMQSFWW